MSLQHRQWLMQFVEYTDQKWVNNYLERLDGLYPWSDIEIWKQSEKLQQYNEGICSRVFLRALNETQPPLPICNTALRFIIHLFRRHYGWVIKWIDKDSGKFKIINTNEAGKLYKEFTTNTDGSWKALRESIRNSYRYGQLWREPKDNRHEFYINKKLISTHREENLQTTKAICYTINFVRWMLHEKQGTLVKWVTQNEFELLDRVNILKSYNKHRQRTITWPAFLRSMLRLCNKGFLTKTFHGKNRYFVHRLS